MKRFLIFSLVVFSAVCSAQKIKIDSLTIGGYDTTARYFMLRQSNVYNQSTAVNQMKDLYSLTNNDSLHLYQSVTDNISRMYRFQQYNSGRPVYGAKMYVHCDSNGVVKIMNGTLINTFLTDATPTISANDAINYAISYCGAQSYMWQDSTLENQLKRIQNNSSATYSPTTEIIYYPIDNTHVAYTLVYNVVICSSVPYNKQSFFIDAKNGNLINAETLISTCIPHNVDPPNKNLSATNCGGVCQNGNGITLYYSTQNIVMDNEPNGNNTSCQNHLDDACHGPDIRTIQATGAEYYHPSNFYGDNTTDMNAAVTAHWAVERTNEFYGNGFNFAFQRNSYDNSNGTIINYMNNNAGGHEGASWDQPTHTLNYGSGLSGVTTSGNPPVAIDIVAHEFTHGVTQFSSALAGTGESGALNEAFSDIMGNMAEFSIKNNYQTFTGFSYVQGDEAYVSGATLNIGSLSLFAQRDMSNPNATQDPNTMGGNFWLDPSNTAQSNDFGGRHINATVIDFWFFLLAEGGSGVNDNGDPFCVTGIGKEKAVKIAYRCWTHYLSTFSNFNNARTFSTQSAFDLFGVLSPEAAQTVAAWHAVGVGTIPSNSGVIITGGSTGTDFFQFNNAVAVHDYSASSGANVTITSNTQISFLVPNGPPPYNNVSFPKGSTLNAFIAPGCNGGFRQGNSNPTQQSHQNNLDASTFSVKTDLVHDLNSQIDYKIMPNPSSGSFYLVVNENLVGSKATIFNSTGKEIGEFTIQNNRSLINLMDYENGIFLIRISSTTGKTYLTRIVKTQ